MSKAKPYLSFNHNSSHNSDIIYLRIPAKSNLPDKTPQMEQKRYKMRPIQTHVIIFLVLFIIATSSTRAQKSPHVRNNHGLSIAIEEMEKANYFSFVMLINMLQPVNPKLVANITFLMPKDKILSRSHIIQQDSVTEFLLRHSIPSPLLFEHLNLIPNGSIVPSSLPHYTLRISNGGKSNYFLNNVKIISRNICNLGSIKCHGIDGILQSPSGVDDNSPQHNNTVPIISCPSSRNNSEDDSHNNGDHNSSRPDHSHTVPSPSSSPTGLPKSDSSKIGGEMIAFMVVYILGLLVSVIGM